MERLPFVSWKVKYLDGYGGPHARFSIEERAVFSGIRCTTAQREKRNIVREVREVPSGTCSSPPRQQLINRPGSSPETTETHRARLLCRCERRFVPTTYFSLTTNEYNSSRTCTVSSHNTSPPLLEITFGHRFIQSENFYLSFIFYTIKYVSFLIFVKYSFFFFFFGKSRKFIFSCWFERQGWNNERRVSKDINGNVRKRRRRAVC